VIVVVVALLLGGWALVAGGRSPGTLFVARFGGPDRLLTNEYATYHPHARGIVRSAQWMVTSGSLFIQAGAATNGHLDRIPPNAHSTNGTNSTVFRAYTKQHFVANYRVAFKLRVRAPRPGAPPQTVAWNGVHLMVNAESPAAAYYVSMYRQDGFAVIKKKTAGGPVAGGTYQALSQYVPTRITPGHWTAIRVDVRQSEGGSVTIDLYEGGTLVVTATDDPALSGSAAYTSGRLGIRADETVFAIKELTVRRL
jgi:hypothetical protein